MKDNWHDLFVGSLDIISLIFMKPDARVTSWHDVFFAPRVMQKIGLLACSTTSFNAHFDHAFLHRHPDSCMATNLFIYLMIHLPFKVISFPPLATIHKMAIKRRALNLRSCWLKQTSQITIKMSRLWISDWLYLCFSKISAITSIIPLTFLQTTKNGKSNFFDLRQNVSSIK